MVESFPNASFQSSKDLCADDVLDLNDLLFNNSSTGGTWTGNGVNGNTFDPSVYTGQSIHILYSVGQGVCTDVAGGFIHVKANNLNSSWNSPGSTPGSGIINLNNFFTNNTTTGGTWSGQGVAGNFFNPAGLSGTIAVTYKVENGVCESETTHNITISGNGSNQTNQLMVDSICEGQISLLNIANPNAGSTYNVYDLPIGGNLVGQLPMYVQPNASATYYYEEVDANGNVLSVNRDSMFVVVNALPTNTPAVATTVCAGEDAGQALNAYGTTFAIWTDSVAGLQVATTPAIIAVPNSTQYYLSSVDPNTGCYSAERSLFDITALPTDLNAYQMNICDGDTINFAGQAIANAGIYSDSYTNAHGCDSIDEA